MPDLPVSDQPTRRRWPRRLAVGGGAVVVLAIAVPFTYIHFIEGTAPAKLTLPASTVGAASDAGVDGTTAGASTGSPEGSWSVGAGSIVGYRVAETLVGQHNTAVGRTTAVTGSLSIDGTSLTRASFTAQMATVTSDETERDHQFDGRIMDVARYPTATFTLTAPIALGAIPQVGHIVSYPAEGTLAMHGQTHPVHFTIHAERTATGLEVQGDIPITFATWGIANPGFGSFVTTADSGTLEVLLDLHRGATSTPTSTPPTTAGSPGGGFGGPITVPATTTPPLSIAG